MSRFAQLKLGLIAAGLIAWGYGARADIAWLRWVGIGFFALAVALRFVGPRSSRRGESR